MTESVLERRRRRAVAARLLLSLHAEGQLDKPSSWSWDALSRLPAWCLLDSVTRQRLQLTCGALFLSAELRVWIRKASLDGLRELLGEAVLESVMAEADRLSLAPEPARHLLEEAGVDDEHADTVALSSALMGAGSAVLSATVHESLPRQLLVQSLGAELGSLDASTAWALLECADHVLALEQASEVAVEELSA